MLLAQIHININAQTSDGETALMKAYDELFDRMLALPTIDLTLRNSGVGSLLAFDNPFMFRIIKDYRIPHLIFFYINLCTL